MLLIWVTCNYYFLLFYFSFFKFFLISHTHSILSRLYLSSIDKIHSSYSQPSKSKKKKKNKNENKENKENKEENDKDYTKTSVLNKFYENNLKDSNEINSIHKFSKMDNYILLMDHRNVIHREPQQGTDKFIILITDHGKKKIKVEEYINHIKNINTDLYLLPSEDILSNSSKSRCQKNVNRSLKLFNDGLNYHSKLKIKESGLISVIQGGIDIEQRNKCCNEMIKSLSTNNFIKENKLNYGYCIGGVGFGESPKLRHEILMNTIKLLNDDKLNKNKLRIINGLDTLNDVISAIGNGCDIIISSYPTKLTLNGDAMIHPISPPNDIDTDIDIDIDINKEKCIDKINIRDIKFATDSSPILDGCKCYCCTNHSRAYIRHLFNVHEMNGQILLQMHNCYRFLHFVENIKYYLKNNKFSQFCQWWIKYQSNLL